MGTVESVLLSLLVLDAIALTVLVLLQQGKGADVGAAFGSGSSNTVFGSAGGAPFLTKMTAWLAIGFFIIAFSLAYIARERANAAGTLGIPTVNTVNTVTDGDTPDQLTIPAEGVDSAPDSDIPVAPEEPASDVPEL